MGSTVPKPGTLHTSSPQVPPAALQVDSVPCTSVNLKLREYLPQLGSWMVEPPGLKPDAPAPTAPAAPASWLVSNSPASSSTTPEL